MDAFDHGVGFEQLERFRAGPDGSAVVANADPDAGVWGGEEVCELGDETVFAEVRYRCRGGLGRFISGPFHGEAAACQ
jgi:hypothetical protein